MRCKTNVLWMDFENTPVSNENFILMKGFAKWSNLVTFGGLTCSDLLPVD